MTLLFVFTVFLLTCVAAKSQRSILMDNMHKSPRKVAMGKKKGQETSTNTQETAQSATAEPSNSVRLFCDLCTVLQVKKKPQNGYVSAALMLFVLILALTYYSVILLRVRAGPRGPDGCRKALGSGQREASSTGRPLCTLCAVGSQPSSNLPMIQLQPHMKPNSLSARTINKDKPHSADHPDLLDCYGAAQNSTRDHHRLCLHLYIKALTT